MKDNGTPETMRYEADSIIELSNQLTINDMVTLIDVFSYHIHLHRIETDFDNHLPIEACTNGHSIQINYMQHVST